jgi:hypothetical protein
LPAYLVGPSALDNGPMTKWGLPQSRQLGAETEISHETLQTPIGVLAAVGEAVHLPD